MSIDREPSWWPLAITLAVCLVAALVLAADWLEL